MTCKYICSVKARIDANGLAQRCSFATVIAASGSANDFNSSAGRVYREAMLFNISGQTIDVMEASSKSLL